MNKSVILLSDKSSGSSILQRELLKNPAINSVRFTSHNECETQYWLKAAVISDARKEDFYQQRRPFNRRYARYALDQIIRDNTGEQMLLRNGEMIHAGWQALTRAFGPVFFEKSPHHLNHWASTKRILEYAARHPGKVQIIGLVRHPLSVIYSTLHRWDVNPLARQKKWVYSYENLQRAMQALPEEQLHLVRYEDLIDNPSTTLEQICTFIGIEKTPDTGEDIHQRSREKWADDLNFKVRILPSTAKMAESFGYEIPMRFLHQDAPQYQRNQGRIFRRWMVRKLRRGYRHYWLPYIHSLLK